MPGFFSAAIRSLHPLEKHAHYTYRLPCPRRLCVSQHRRCVSLLHGMPWRSQHLRCISLLQRMVCRKNPQRRHFVKIPRLEKYFQTLFYTVYIYISIYIYPLLYIYNIYILFRSYWAVMWMTRVTLKWPSTIGLTLDAPKFGRCGRTWR